MKTKPITAVLISLLIISLFTVNLQAQELLKTRQIAGGQPAIEISVDISGVNTLELIATGYSWGQAVWGEPVLIAEDGSITRLVDLKPIEVNIGWGKFASNTGPDGKALKIADRNLAHGLFAHADSRVLYRLEGKNTKLKAWVGINHTANNLGKVIFEVHDAGDYEMRLRRERANAIFTKPVIAELKTILGDENVSSQKQLQVLAAFEKDIDVIVNGLASNNLQALERAENFISFARKIYLSQIDAPLLFVKRNEYWAGHIYDDYLTWNPGGGIYILENPSASSEDQIVRPLIDPETGTTLGSGVYRDPELSWDAKRVLFAFKDRKDGDTSIYEIGINDKSLKRLTEPGNNTVCLEPQPGLIGAGHHDIAPCYLPDDSIAFTSTRTGGHVMCFSSYIDTLHAMDADGDNVRSISVNNQNEFDPVVMTDGRILYGRWEYVDKTALYMQSLWTVNPDGSNEMALFANNLAKPTAILDARPVPNSNLIVASLTPHNGQPVGAIAMIDSRKGKNNLDAVTNFTPEYPTEMDQGLSRGPCDPWPLSEDIVLISNNDPEHGTHGVIELITRAGFRTVIHSEPGITCYSPMLIKPRKVPPVKPSLIMPGEPGKFMVTDIYKGMDGVKHGEVKWLRVVETTSRISGIPPGGRWWNQAFLVSWQGSYDIKKFLGIVPVEDDGSVYFEAPTGKALYFQALDEKGRLIQSQRTFVQSMPGITRSCIGCHVKDDDIAPVNSGARPSALGSSLVKLKPESWGAGYIDYPSMVQPILDRRCVSCHGGNEGIEGGIDLSGGWTWAFNISYETLIKNTMTGFLNCNNGSVHTAEILPPRSHGSANAPLTNILLNGHGGRLEEMTDEEVDLLMAWMDGNCNYYGTWDYSQFATCNEILKVTEPLVNEMEKAGCVNCHQPAIGNDWVNLENPERSRILRAPMAKVDGGLGLQWCRKRNARSLDIPLVNQSIQPPDIARPVTRKAPDPSGKKFISFVDTKEITYQAMLKIIQQARNKALNSPRVDMPGARITKGDIANRD